MSGVLLEGGQAERFCGTGTGGGRTGLEADEFPVGTFLELCPSFWIWGTCQTGMGRRLSPKRFSVAFWSARGRGLLTRRRVSAPCGSRPERWRSSGRRVPGRCVGP